MSTPPATATRRRPKRKGKTGLPSLSVCQECAGDTAATVVCLFCATQPDAQVAA